DSPCAAGRTIQHTQLAKKTVFGGKSNCKVTALTSPLAQFHLSGQNQIKAIGWLALLKDNCLGGKRFERNVLAERLRYGQLKERKKLVRIQFHRLQLIPIEPLVCQRARKHHAGDCPRCNWPLAKTFSRAVEALPQQR